MREDYSLAVTKDYKIGFWVLEPKIVSSAKENFAQSLRVLGSIHIQDLEGGADDPQTLDQDLLIVDATHFPMDYFDVWMQGFVKRMMHENRIWIPALIYGDFEFDSVKKYMDLATQKNWYFDLVSKHDFETLPLRVANLFKIHDHLKEIAEYQNTLQELEDKVKNIENKMRQP